MSKRKLSEKQLRRTENAQHDRIKRVKNNHQDLTPDILGPEKKGLLIASFRNTYIVKTKTGDLIRCQARQNLGSIVVGDNVVWQNIEENKGVISAVLDRSSLLERPNYLGKTKPVAANIDQILIMSSPAPELQTSLIDRYLVSVELNDIRPIIVVNKIDLLSEKQLEEMQSMLNEYASIGYELHFVTTLTRKGINELQDTLRNKVSVLVGKSGVGKSSTIKTILPDETIQIGEISESKKLGRHTTTASRLYDLPFGGALIDSPGVRDFGLWHLPKENIAFGFKEFRPFLGSCKFKNCTHRSEPHCAIQFAVEENQISLMRWKNYSQIFTSLENKPK